MIDYNFPLIGGKLIERKIAQWRAEGYAEGFALGRAEAIAETRAEGLAEGRSRKNAEWSDWNNRRMEAKRNGVPFLAPPPDDFIFPPIVEERIERKIAEWIAEGYTEGFAKMRAESFVEGVAQENAEWSDWNSRRMDAERNGAPFDEPPPHDGARAMQSGKERE